ncbi:hypothetical protein CH373_05500 [Leptospira perolatii]|uniref:Uncharacterized protein n=1 Tax=Leptospira perolatii TaxID=2023191 RepID=A0A2M9ZQK4_9LEPT|nr:hypothetical protein [Leptospira perolatii]PJZ70524.1 hypothetical protein CH360_05920 [Leptospira perolatii]PJZ74360.1 hypothetical protein CH373_05500 [Leptospira perolatii]
MDWIVKRNGKRLVALLLVALALGCNSHGDKPAPGSFSDNLEQGGSLHLFNLLDEYPSLKAGFHSLKPADFNLRLDSSMRIPDRIDIVGFLRASGDMLLKPEANTRQSLQKVHAILDRLEGAPNQAFDVLQPWLERLRNYSKPVLRNLAPISQNALHYLYSTLNKEETETKYREFSTVLKRAEIKEIFIDLEDVANKALNQNANAKSAIQNLLAAMTDPSLSGDRILKNKIVKILSSIGESFRKRAGFTDFKSSETVLKELVINLEKYFTVGGEFYSDPALPDYRDPNFPANFSTVLVESFRYLRPMLTKGGNYTSDPNVLLSQKLSQNLFKLDFAPTMTGVDQSLRDLIRVDYLGRDRAYSIDKYTISALESLMFILTLADTYGFRWENPSDTTMMRLEPNGSVNGGPMTGGILTVGDSIYSLGSAMTGNLGVKAFLNQSANDGAVFRDGDASTPTPFQIFLNSPTLTLLESPDRSIVPTSNDQVYIKTIPFMMRMILNVVLSGGGPYYNKNRVDSLGNIYTIDGKLYKNSNGDDLIYKSSWNTTEYRIKVADTVNGSCTSGSLCRWVGPGGRETTATFSDNSFTQVANGQNASGEKGWSIPVWEIGKQEVDRAVNTDEEAIYRNFQWLLTEKRMVAVIPLRASLGSGVPYKMAAYATVIANGLKGLMGARPILADGASCSQKVNGIWRIKGNLWKPGCATANQPNFREAGIPILQENFSELPGDSMFYLEAWDYGTSGTSPITFNSLGDSNVYNIFYPPTSQYGVIPQAIAANFPVMERLAFLTPDNVSPSQVASYWNTRNRLLPLIIALAKTLDEQTDSIGGKNPYQLLTGLSAILSRPLLTNITDPESGSGGRTITVMKTMMADASIRNRAAGEEEYLFRWKDPITEKPIRSMLSILSENRIAYQDGFLNLVSRTDLLSTLVQMLAEMGRPSRASGANQTFQAISGLVDEIKLTNESPAPNQFNLQTYLEEVEVTLAAYPDSRPTNVYDPVWNDLGAWAVRLRDYFDKESIYSLIPMIDFSLDMILDNVPSQTEIAGILDLVGSLFRNSQGNQDHLITELLTSDTPKLLDVTAPYGRSLNGVLMGLSKSGEFFSYLEQDMKTPYSIKDMFSDTKKLLNSEMIQTPRQDESSLLFTAGTLMGIFADLTERGHKPFPGGTVFYDRFNKNEDSDTYWDRFVSVFSR